MSFSAQIRKLLSQKGLSQTVFAESIGITKGRLNNYIMGRSEPDYELLKKIAVALDVSTDYLLEIPTKAEAESNKAFVLDENYAMVLSSKMPKEEQDPSSWIPIYRSSSEKVPSSIASSEVAWMRVPDAENYSLPTRGCYALLVSDDSMTPSLLPGDLVITRPMISYLFLDGSDTRTIYSVRLTEEDEVGLSLRHCVLAGDLLSILPDNPKFGADAFNMGNTPFVPIAGRSIRMIRNYEDINKFFVG